MPVTDDENLNRILEGITEAGSKLGLQTLGIGLAFQGESGDTETRLGEQEVSLSDLVQSEDGSVFIQAQFQIGPMAWTDRVLHPEKIEELETVTRLVDELELNRKAALAELLEEQQEE